MTVNEINPKKLKADTAEQTLWYRGDKGDLFIIFTKTQILHFEVTIEDRHLEGGYEKPMRYGLVDSEEHIKDAMQFKRSRMVRFEDEVPKSFVDETIEIVYQSENLETSMKQGIMTFLSSKGSDDRGLKLESGKYESFRVIVPPPFDFRGFIARKWKTALGFVLLGVIGTFVYKYTQKSLLERACKNGNTVACANLGMMNTIYGEHNPNKVWQDSVVKTRVELKASCDKGDMKSCYSYVAKMISLKKMTNEDYLPYRDRGCEQNVMQACYSLAKEAYFKGDLKKAMELFDKNCAYNYSDSCEYVLAEKEYAHNLEQCENGDKEACFKAAIKEISDGKGADADKKLERNCEVGHAPSCSKLADLSARNKQVGRAQGLFYKACQMNDLKSCFSYRYMTAVDSHAKRIAEAMWKDCQNGSESSCLDLKNIK